MPKRSAEDGEAALIKSVRKELGKVSEMSLKALKKAVGSELEKSEFKKAVKQAAKAEDAGFTVEGKEVKLVAQAEKPAKKSKKEKKSAAADTEKDEKAGGNAVETSPEIQVNRCSSSFILSRKKSSC